MAGNTNYPHTSSALLLPPIQLYPPPLTSSCSCRAVRSLRKSPNGRESIPTMSCSYSVHISLLTRCKSSLKTCQALWRWDSCSLQDPPADNKELLSEVAASVPSTKRTGICHEMRKGREGKGRHRWWSRQDRDKGRPVTVNKDVWVTWFQCCHPNGGIDFTVQRFGDIHRKFEIRTTHSSAQCDIAMSSRQELAVDQQHSFWLYFTLSSSSDNYTTGIPKVNGPDIHKFSSNINYCYCLISFVQKNRQTLQKAAI